MTASGFDPLKPLTLSPKASAEFQRVIAEGTAKPSRPIRSDLMQPATHEQLAAAFRRRSPIPPDPPDVLPMPEDVY